MTREDVIASLTRAVARHQFEALRFEVAALTRDARDAAPATTCPNRIPAPKEAP